MRIYLYLISLTESSTANQTEVADRELSSATNDSSMCQSSSRISLEADSLQNSFSALRTSDKDDQTYFDVSILHTILMQW